MKILRPYRFFDDITHITLDCLKEEGVKGLFLDIDGTLMPTKTKNPEKAVLDWIEDMRNGGIILYVLSNNRNPQRVEELSRLINIPDFVHHAGKPLKRGFLNALEISGLTAPQAAMVGDQIFTDVLGANRVGIRSFLVPSTDTDLWYFPLRCFFEKPFMKKG